MQERTIRDYVKNLPKCLPVIFLFQEQWKFFKHYLTWQKFPLTHCQGNICERHGRNHINAHFTESFLSESSFLVSSIPNVCVKGHILCPMVSAQLMGAGAVVAVATVACGSCLSVGSLGGIMQTHAKEGGPCGTLCDQANSDLFTKTCSFPNSCVLLSHDVVLRSRWGNCWYFLRYVVMPKNWKIFSKSSFPSEKTFPSFIFSLRSSLPGSSTWHSRLLFRVQPRSTAQEKTDTDYCKWIQLSFQFDKVPVCSVSWARPQTSQSGENNTVILEDQCWEFDCSLSVLVLSFILKDVAWDLHVESKAVAVISRWRIKLGSFELCPSKFPHSREEAWPGCSRASESLYLVWPLGADKTEWHAEKPRDFSKMYQTTALTQGICRY